MNNTSPFIRQLKIDLITDTPNPLIQKFEEIWDGLTCLKIDVYLNKGVETIYYRENNSKLEWILYYNENYELFIFNYAAYWSTFNNMLMGDIPLMVRMLLIENKMNIYTNPSYSAPRDSGNITEAIVRVLQKYESRKFNTQAD